MVKNVVLVIDVSSSKFSTKMKQVTRTLGITLVLALEDQKAENAEQ